MSPDWSRGWGLRRPVDEAFAMMMGPWQLLIVLVIALLLFGKRIPAAMRSLGLGVTEFKKGLHDGADETSAARSSAED